MQFGIIILNGPPAAGKSTVALELRRRYPESAHISGDALRLFTPVDASAILGPGSTYRAAAILSNFYLQAGASVVIFDYVFEGPIQVDYFSSVIDPNTPCRLVTLWAPLLTLQIRDAARTEATRQGARVVQSVEAMQPHLGDLGCVIDTSNKSVQDIAQHVQQHLPSMQCLTHRSAWTLPPPVVPTMSTLDFPFPSAASLSTPPGCSGH
jgi:chloramphenicol 3-O-phosphotransferase